MHNRHAFFLDRDGVIIKNRANYVRAWKDVEFLPGALRALRDLAKTEYIILIITNQSAVGRGLITLNQATSINTKLVQVIDRHHGRVDRVYMCPHQPEDQCNCRKPKPGMILTAKLEFDLDLSKSVLIGDTMTDLLAGERAGIHELNLVRTGLGKFEETKLAQHQPNNYRIYSDLDEAIQSYID